MHVSIPIENSIQFIEETRISPLVSKGVAKVFYVGANRNKTYIDVETAIQLGKTLPGSPVVGYFREDINDFEEHSKRIEIENNKFKVLDLTRPYGFVAPDAKVWFQTFVDDGVEHLYLCCEIYLWTEAYPESKRVFEKGNNQSMELQQESVQGHWTKAENGTNNIFIINEALIQKLCILGENYEPCFEGATVQKEFAASLEVQIQHLRESLFSLMSEVDEVLGKGGSNMMDPVENAATCFEAVTQDETVSDDAVAANIAEDTTDVAIDDFKKKDNDDEDKSDKEDSSDSDNNIEDSNSDDDDDKKKKYSLSDFPEYAMLLEEKANLEKQIADLQAENTSLKEFKVKAERVSKQDKIDEFYMLSDEDKADVVKNIDTYSIDDIEAKLSVICFRNKISFDSPKSKENNSEVIPTSFSLNRLEEDDIPEWVKSVKRAHNS